MTDEIDDFDDVEDARRRLGDVGYLADGRLATTVFLQSRLGKPVLLEGPAGVGKTQLALSLARATGRRLLRLQCYEGQDETKALYEWDYGKQLLYTQILREKIGQIVADAADLHESVERIGAQESVFFSERFLAPRPLLQAISSPEPVVLLIDEVDRADEALEAVLLESLAEFQVSIPEIGTVTARHQPYVVLTSNNTRDLSAALKRRCLHLFLDYPSPERELEILRSKDTGLPMALAERLVEVVRGLRELDLRKAPSISETIDWARTLSVLGVSELSAQVLADTLNVVVKYERDVQKATAALPRLVDPNATVPAAHGHGLGHGHGHGHGADHDHGGDHDHDHDHDHDEPGGADGRAVRAAKDAPGRHDTDYYGAPGRGAGIGRRPVSREQGERSFTRKRPV
ncbi:AAA family ATPase [Lapillicoccus jejuensis]|uniref:Dynein-related subfamily AAA family protein n=1 Tax=Lapillicoccus jejuensis TaxID=402171 RepID=A0A542E3E5_9MICO|nr:MoxR family ATPase [Lapillicoccus jejuensis]TQJ09863.1 dynein-related subfamily AAA family protein [Lapillicoccus jejuensis]